MKGYSKNSPELVNLTKNLEFTYGKLKRIEEYDEFIQSISNKLIDLGCFGHLILLSLFSFGVMMAIFSGFLPLKEEIYEKEYFLLFIIFAYCLIIWFINWYFIFIKKTIKNEKIQRYTTHRIVLISELTKKTVLPSDYWNSYLVNILIKYIENGRAESLNEALNLLEAELRHDEQMRQLAIIEEEMSRPRIFAGYSD